MLIIIVLMLTPVILAVNEKFAPIHYSITIEPEFESFSFKGIVEITLDVRTNDVNSIRIPIDILSFSEVKAFLFESQEELETNFNLNLPGFIVIAFRDALTPDLYLLKFTYTGILNENLEGFYVANYKKIVDATEITSPFALTNLQFDNAKKVFPCFDDPENVATFTLKIIRPIDYKSFTNSPKLLEEPSGEKVMDIFEKTTVMPTFLLSFAVVNFDKIPDTLLNVYGSKIENAEFLLSAITEISKTIGTATDNLLHIVVPDNALVKDTLESPGIIFYRESCALITPGVSTTKEIQKSFTTIAHGLGLQQSLALTIPSPWSHYWITEATTSVFQQDVLDLTRPTWRISEQFVVVDMHTALENDVGETSWSLMVNKPNLPLLDNPTFSMKATSVMRMLVRLYDKTVDEIVSDYDIIGDWANIAGYPLITVSRDYVSGKILVNQEGFFTEEYSPLDIALVFHDTLSDFDLGILDVASREFEVLRDPNSFIILNKNQYGYHRTNYDSNNWNLINKYLRGDDLRAITPIDRAQLIDDAYNLAEFDLIDYSVYLELIRYVSKEEDYIPLYTFFRTTTKLKSLLTGTEIQQKFMLYAREMLFSLYEKLGPIINPSEAHTERLKRIALFNWLCDFGYEKCHEDMFDLFSDYLPVHPDLEESVFCGGMRLGSQLDFIFLATQYQSSGKERILKGMGCTSHNESLKYYLFAVIDDSPVLTLKPEDRLTAFSAIYQGSDEGLKLAFTFIETNFDVITEKFNFEEISEMVLGLAQKLRTESHVTRLNEIIENLNEYVGTFGTIFNEAKEIALNNVKWTNAQVEEITAWLETKDTTSTESTSTKISTPTTTVPSTTTDSAIAIEVTLMFLVVYSILLLVTFR